MRVQVPLSVFARAEVAQLAEAIDSKSIGCGFDSHLRYFEKILHGRLSSYGKHLGREDCEADF